MLTLILVAIFLIPLAASVIGIYEISGEMWGGLGRTKETTSEVVKDMALDIGLLGICFCTLIASSFALAMVIL